VSLVDVLVKIWVVQESVNEVVPCVFEHEEYGDLPRNSI
jgi:hypothetical protein